VNVLITAAGRSNFLLRRIREAMAGNGCLLTTDMNAAAPALREADRSFVVPSFDEPGYLDALLGICERHRVGLLISLLELENPLIARHRECFERVGTFPLVQDMRVFERCRDKLATQELLRSLGVASPRTFVSLAGAEAALEQGMLELPIVLKPRWGSGSLGVEYPATLDELRLAYRLALLRSTVPGAGNFDEPEAPQLLIQEKLDGEEYGLDVVNDLRGRYVTTFVRRKLRMRGGNTDRAVTANHAGLSALGRQLGEQLGHIGSMDCDVIVSGDRMVVLDMNPRIGGGLPFSLAAGANLPAALLAWRRGEAADPSWLTVEPNVVVAKFDDFTVIE